MTFFNSAVDVLQTLVIALGAGLGIWGVINLLEGYGNDNPGAKSQGMKQLMLPCFLFAMYEKHGQPLETLIKNIIQTKFIRPKERPYQTENFYAVLERQRQLEKEVSAIVNGKRKTRRKQA